MTIEQAHQGGITSAHACFERVTGKKYQLHTHRIYIWEKFLINCKFTEVDIELVVKYLQGEIAGKRTYPPVLWFSNLIEQPDRFEEYLNEARAKKRNALPLRTDHESVLESTGRNQPIQSHQADSISMNDRVQWHLEQMRKAING